MKLEGNRIVVTGGARGIGGSAVAAFARAGATVTSLDLLDELGEQVAAAATSAGPGRARYIHCDITDRAAVESAFAQAAGAMGGIDRLVNVAAVERRAPAEQISDADWDLTLNVNVRGTFLTNQLAFPHLVAAGGGRIVNYASGAAFYPYVGGAHYSASKGAVISWTRTIAHEWAPHGIAANVVCPAMWTPMYEESRARYSPEQLVEHEAKMKQRIPLGGRLGDPDADMAPVLVFLLSEDARFINAQVISVDGGMVPLR